jgi:hypothetical protein
MGYTLNVLGAAIGVRSAVGDAALVTVSEGAGKKSAALIFADKHVEKVKTGFAWSEAVAMDSTSIVANAQKDAGKTFPVVVSRAGDDGRGIHSDGLRPGKASFDLLNVLVSEDQRGGLLARPFRHSDESRVTNSRADSDSRSQHIKGITHRNTLHFPGLNSPAHCTM